MRSTIRYKHNLIEGGRNGFPPMSDNQRCIGAMPLEEHGCSSPSDMLLFHYSTAANSAAFLVRPFGATALTATAFLPWPGLRPKPILWASSLRWAA